MECLTWLYPLFYLFFLYHSQVASSSSFSNSSSRPGTLCLPDQRLALLQLKNMFAIDTYSFCCGEYLDAPSTPKTDSWTKGTDCCLWDGVTCDLTTGHVIGLDLSANKLAGGIHPNSSLFSLRHLQRLNLACNNFYMAQIPPGFSHLSSLTYLDLSCSSLSGPLPSKFSHLSNLVSLNLSGNLFAIEIPSFRGIAQNFTELKELILDSTDMSSVSPSFLMNLSSSLTHLSLVDCGLQGKLPSNILKSANLQIIYLSKNPSLSGNLPKSHWNNSLKFLGLSDTGFSGEMPHSICGLKSLELLSLANCHLTGQLLACLGNLTEISSLDLSANAFTGHIPSSFSKLEQLILLSLTDNNFKGQIPDIFGNMTQLTGVYLSDNQLTGLVPSSFGGLLNLNSLTLSFNRLNGTIPSSIFSLPSLMCLVLRNNNFTGHISELRSNSFVNIDLGFNELSGSIPMSISEQVNLVQLVLSSNKLSGTLDFHMFSKLQVLHLLDLSNNNLSIISGSKIDYIMPMLQYLTLSSCNLTKFPSFLRALTHPRELHLSRCNIHGHFPKWTWVMWKYSFRVLDFSHNFLTSMEKIPWRSLSVIDLQSNLLQGPVPLPPLLTTYFSVARNNLSGEIPLSFCDLSPHLQILDLSHNHLNGTIPKCLGNSNNALTVLNLRMNDFDGTISGICGKKNRLRNLDLNGNHLEGPLPRSLVHCESLEVLDLGNNNITDNFPHWLAVLPQLQVLVLRSNRLHGAISDPEAKFPFPKLRIMDLSHNHFTGALPTTYLNNLKALMNMDQSDLEYMQDLRGYQYSVTVTVKGLEIDVRILTIFTTIDLSENSFRGEIPKIIGKLNSLRLLNLSRNSLSGHIPSSLGNVTALESLDLSWNKLVGQIPAELASLTFLAKLNLSHNKLVGQVPQGNQFGTFSNDSFGGNLGLCGSPLTRKCGTEAEPRPPTIQEEDDLDFLSGFNWKVVSMGYGCGTVLGMVVGYIVVVTGKPQWLVRLVVGGSIKKIRSNQRRAMRRTT